MHNDHRYMARAGDAWVIRCRICPRSRNTRRFPTRKQCHDWWREHEANGTHAALVQRVADARDQQREGRLASGELLLREIFGDYQPHDPGRLTSKPW